MEEIAQQKTKAFTGADEQQVRALLLTKLGMRLGIPNAREAMELLEEDVAPRRVFSLYPFELSEWKDPRSFRLSREHVGMVLSNLNWQYQEVVEHLPATHRQVLGQLRREYDAELARLDSIRRAHSMNVSASEDWEYARHKLLTAAYVLHALCLQLFPQDESWPAAEKESLARNLPKWEGAIRAVVKAMRPGVLASDSEGN